MEIENQLPQSMQPGKGTTFLRTCFNGLNVLAGLGILSVPFALAEGGWLSLILLLLVGCICLYTGLLLQKCMDEDTLTIKTYPDIGQFAFGSKGRTIISIFMYLELYLVAVEFLILEGDNLHKLFPSVEFRVAGHAIGGKQVFTLLTALVILPTTWLKNLGALAYVSLGGIFASMTLLVSVFWVATFDGVGFHEKGVIWKWNGLPTTASLYTFCYCGHAVFPTLYSSMKDKSKFPKVLIVCYILSTFIYGSLAVLGYLMFGNNVVPQITLNLPTKYLSSKIAIYTTLVSPITKYALVVSPISAALEDKFAYNHNRTMSILIRTSLVASTAIVAEMVPFFGYVLTFTGSSLSISVSILFPCLCYMKITQAFRNIGIELILIVIVLVFGAFIAVTGTYSSLRGIIMHVKPE